MRWLSFLVVALLFWCAAVLENVAGLRLVVGGICPDFLLTLALCLACLSEPAGGAMAGFSAGVVTGALYGANMTAYVLSRTLVSFGFANLYRFKLKVEPVMAGLLVALGTLLAQVLLMFLAPPAELWPFLRNTLGKAIFDGVVAMPLFVLLRPMFKPKAV